MTSFFTPGDRDTSAEQRNVMVVAVVTGTVGLLALKLLLNHLRSRDLSKIPCQSGSKGLLGDLSLPQVRLMHLRSVDTHQQAETRQYIFCNTATPCGLTW